MESVLNDKEAIFEELRRGDPDRFLMAMLAPPNARAPLLALYAFNHALAHVKDVVSEEMIGRIRLAWWREAIDALEAGKPIPPQPVLQMIAAEQISTDALRSLIELYEEHFPAPPPNLDGWLNEMSLTLLYACAPEATRRWRKVAGIIARHRRHHGPRKNMWLHVKLLII